jgi:Ca2+-transporting ATPase
MQPPPVRSGFGRRSPAPRDEPTPSVLPTTTNYSATSSSSSYTRYPSSAPASSMRGPPPPHTTATMRPDSPPASAYFHQQQQQQHGPPGGAHTPELRAAPGAGAHFAYSTTLRRHPAEDPLAAIAHGPQVLRDEGPAGLWHKAVDVFGGAGASAASGGQANGHGHGYAPVPKEEQKDTASARFAHYSVEVSVANLFFVVVVKAVLAERHHLHFLVCFAK